MRLLYMVCVALGLLSVSACPTMAAYGGLVCIPTADTVGMRLYSLDMQGDDSLPNQISDVRFLNTQFGLSSRLEAGVDFDFGEENNTKSIFNAKYAFKVDARRELTLAGGIYGVEANVKSVPYLVATKCLSSHYRLHLGGQRIEANNRWFVGMDKAIGDQLTLMADYTSGVENCSSVGVNYQFSDSFGVLIGAQYPNEDNGDTVYAIHFTVGGNYRKCPCPEEQ